MNDVPSMQISVCFYEIAVAVVLCFLLRLLLLLILQFVLTSNHVVGVDDKIVIVEHFFHTVVDENTILQQHHPLEMALNVDLHLRLVDGDVHVIHNKICMHSVTSY